MPFPDIDWLMRVNREVEALASFIPIKSTNLKVTGAFVLLMSGDSVGRSECWRSEQAKKRFSLQGHLQGGQTSLTVFSCVFQYQIARSRTSSFGERTQALVSAS